MNGLFSICLLAVTFAAANAKFTSNVDCAGMYLSCIERLGSNPEATPKILNTMSARCHAEIRAEPACSGVDSVPFRRMKLPHKQGDEGKAAGETKDPLEPDGPWTANVDCAGLYLDCIEWESTWSTVKVLNSMSKRCKGAIRAYQVCQGHDIWS